MVDLNKLVADKKKELQKDLTFDVKKNRVRKQLIDAGFVGLTSTSIVFRADELGFRNVVTFYDKLITFDETEILLNSQFTDKQIVTYITDAITKQIKAVKKIDSSKEPKTFKLKESTTEFEDYIQFMLNAIADM